MKQSERKAIAEKVRSILLKNLDKALREEFPEEGMKQYELDEILSATIFGFTVVALEASFEMLEFNLEESHERCLHFTKTLGSYFDDKYIKAKNDDDNDNDDEEAEEIDFDGAAKINDENIKKISKILNQIYSIVKLDKKSS